jgi:hypothetical protein
MKTITPGHIIVEFLKTKDKEKKKSSQGNNKVIRSNGSRERCEGILKVLKKEDPYGPRSPIPRM